MKVHIIQAKSRIDFLETVASITGRTPGSIAKYTKKLPRDDKEKRTVRSFDRVQCKVDQMIFEGTYPITVTGSKPGRPKGQKNIAIDDNLFREDRFTKLYKSSDLSPLYQVTCSASWCTLDRYRGKDYLVAKNCYKLHVSKHKSS